MQGLPGLLGPTDRLAGVLRWRHGGQDGRRFDDSEQLLKIRELTGGGRGWKSGADAARSGAKELEEDSRCSGDHFAGVVGIRGEVGRRAHGGAEERRHSGARSAVC